MKHRADKLRVKSCLELRSNDTPTFPKIRLPARDAARSVIRRAADPRFAKLVGVAAGGCGGDRQEDTPAVGTERSRAGAFSVLAFPTTVWQRGAHGYLCHSVLYVSW
jgi:hypothetical protein